MAGETIAKLKQSVRDFCNGNEQFDDMAILALFRTETVNKRIALPIELKSFDKIKTVAFSAAGDTPEVRRALLACDEALTNIVEYSGAKNLSFLLEKTGSEMTVTFTDDGEFFDPTSVQSEEKEFEELSNGGMGINIMRQSSSEMEYRYEDGHNVLTLRFEV